MKPDIETQAGKPPNIEEQERPINKVTYMEEKIYKRSGIWSVNRRQRLMGKTNLRLRRQNTSHRSADT